MRDSNYRPSQLVAGKGIGRLSKATTGRDPEDPGPFSLEAECRDAVFAEREVDSPVQNLRPVLPLQRAPIWNYLTCDDVGIERHRPIAARTNLDVMTPGCERERLPRRREFAHLADVVVIHVDLCVARRDLEAHA